MNMRQQAEQKKNTVNILIGLGGTGIDTIRSIKTQRYERIKSDESEYKSYSRIRFLGIDRNEKSRDVLQSNGTTKYVALGEDEFLGIRTDVHKLLQNYRLLENRVPFLVFGISSAVTCGAVLLRGSFSPIVL